MRSINTNNNVLRNILVKDFVGECLLDTHIQKIAIVGGSLSDPEVFEIKEEFPDAIFETYGIEASQNFMDLNLPPVEMGEFDMVLCTNVIEHVFNHENFSKNLMSLLKSNGILWCAFPFNDMYHGSPYYYSAGFDPGYVERLFARNGGVTLKSKIIGARRLYLFTHFLQDWPSEFRYLHPTLGQILWGLGFRNNPRPPIRNLSARRLLICLYLSMTSKQFNSEPTNGCGVWLKISKI
jgi:SAM-dependent methyltransferase